MRKRERAARRASNDTLGRTPARTQLWCDVMALSALLYVQNELALSKFRCTPALAFGLKTNWRLFQSEWVAVLSTARADSTLDADRV